MSMSKKPKNLKKALKYSTFEWKVLPLFGIENKKCKCGNASCASPGKHPATKNGVNDASNDPKTIREWFNASPLLNIGIATGEGSNLLVLDIDERHGGYESLAAAMKELGQLPPTLTVQTGGGEHRYFFRPEGSFKKDNSGKLIGAGVDVLVDRCYVVAPGSRHVNGKKYKWKHGEPSESRMPASLPDKWVRRLQGTSVATASSSSVSIFGEGERNANLASYVGKLVRVELEASEILRLARDFNEKSCSPSLDDEEVVRTVESISRYGGPSGDPGEQLLNATFHRHFAGGDHIVLGSDSQVYSYDGKKWNKCNIEEVKGKVLETIETVPGPKNRPKSAAMRQAIDLLRPTLTRRQTLDLEQPAPPVINCLNGELWIDENGDVQLRAHSPRSFLRHCLDVKYDPTATCPEFDKAILEIFSKAKNPEEMVRHWHEISGYLIQATRKIPLVLILYGGGGNGKTELVNVVAELMGKDLVLWDRISSADNNRFFFGSLAGKLLLVDDDVTIGTRLPDGELKKISEAKRLSGELKFSPSFNFTCLAVPVLLCNSPMSLSDVGNGMRRRLMVIPFERQFEEREIDRTLFQRIKAAEMSGILNRAIEGYQRVVKRRFTFEKPKAVRAAGKRWFDEANPIATFVSERCELGANHRVQLSELYNAYTAWCETAGVKQTQHKTNFSRNVQNIVGGGSKKANKGTAIIGIRLNNDLASL